MFLKRKVFIKHLLGSLLLLLLLLLGLTIILRLGRGLLGSGWGSLFLLLLLLNGNEETNDVLGLDHVVLINLELIEDIIDLSLGHLVSPGHEGVCEHLGVDLLVGLVSREGLDDDIISVIALASHLLLEHGNRVVRGAGSRDLSQEAVKLALRHKDTNVVKGAPEVVLVDGAILVDVHQLEAVLVHLDLLLGEASLILTLSHFESCLKLAPM